MPQASTPTQAQASTRQVRDLPVQVRAATLEPSTFNAADNTVDVVWTQGAAVRRYDYWEGKSYDEALEVSDTAVDMMRFDAGTVQVLDAHQVHGGVNAILGIAQRGWIENGEGRATLRLSSRPEVAGIVSDIKAGVIRAISFGYSVQQYQITPGSQRDDGGSVDLYRAVRWTPQEISFVTVPADAGAGTRGAQQSPQGQPSQVVGQPCEFVRAAAHQPATMERLMPIQIDQGAGGTANAQPTGAQAPVNEQRAAPVVAQAPAALPVAAPVGAVVASDATRSADILALCNRHNFADLAEGLIRNNNTVEQAREAILNRMDASDAARRGGGNVSIRTVADEHDTRIRGMAEALMHRMDARAVLTDLGRQYRGLSLIEMARDFLGAQGTSTRGMSRGDVVTQVFRSGYHNSGDFPSLLGGVGSRRLRAAYDVAPSTFQMWAYRAANLQDFRITNALAVGGAPELKKLNEAGEYTYGTIKEDSTGYRAFSYGRAIALTRQMFVNDDLGAFDKLLTRFGESARRLENRLVYDQLLSNPVMGDGKKLFHADHGNLMTGAASAFGLDSMKALRTGMRKQKDLDNQALNLTPAFLIVGSDLEGDAYQYTSSNYVPAKVDDVNEFRQGGRTAVEPIVEPLLDESSSKAFYMLARPGQIDTVEYAYVDGSEGVRTETFASEDIDGVKVRATLDFAAKVIDWRGVQKSTGEA